MDLSIFEAKALAHALTNSGHSVSERTVQRWKKGTTKPKPQDVRAIRTLVGITITESEEAPSAEADGALDRLEAVTVRLEQVATGLGSRADAWRRSVADVAEDAELDAGEHLPHRRTRGPKSPQDGGA